MNDLAQRIDALLPQTQCRRCGFDGCRPYAEAVAEGRADLDRCPPGGDAGAARIAALVGRAARPVDRARGAVTAPRVAVIDEPNCIGCTKCIQACPVDAIAGASKRMHTVIAAWCTGCELCIPPCPTDCITLAAAPALPPPEDSRRRYLARGARLARDEAERAARLAAYE